MICGHCKEAGVTVQHVRECDHALPYASTITKDDETKVEERGSNYFVQPQNVFRYDNQDSKHWADDMAKAYPAPQRVYLRVPFNEKDHAKALGARWDPEKREWWCESDKTADFRQWFKAPPTTPKYYPRDEFVVDNPPPNASVKHHFNTPKEPVDLGTYRFGDKFYQVVDNQAKTNRYAKLLEHDASRLEEGKKSPWHFVYAPGIIGQLTSEMRVTAADAKEFAEASTTETDEGSMQFCCMCATPIEHPESLLRGYGPVCASKNGLPYDHSRRKDGL